MWHLNFLALLKEHAGLPLRLVVGYAFFVVHGLDKIKPDEFDWGQEFASSGAAPTALLYLAAWTEFLGGFALILGLLTRWASLGLMCVMGYAFFKVHGGDPFEDRELAFVYMGATAALLVTGPGPLSLDRLFFGREGLEPQN